MLGKLIKHELKATGRILLPLYIIMIVISFASRLLTNIDIFTRPGPLKIISVFIITAYVLSILGVIVITFIIMVQRFYKNLMTDEGYLMFTLPVKPSQLINSKMIVSLIWNVVSIIAVAMALFILLATPSRIDSFKEFVDFIFSSLKLSFGNQYILITTEFVLMLIASLFQQSLLIYVSIAIGHMFSGHKILGSFAAYIAITTVVQVVTTLFLLIWAYFAGSTLESLEAVPQLVFPFTIVLSTILNVLYYLATNYIFKRKLNLE